MATTLVIVGVTGDLSEKKIIPAVYNLLKQKKLEDITLIGVGTRDITSKEIIDKAIKKDDATKKELIKKLTYLKGDVTKEETYTNLAKTIPKNDEIIFYLAISPDFFKVVTTHLKPFVKRAKVAFEKPFGNDSKQAEELSTFIHNIFPEEKIYRVDHYLGKELVQNLAIIRFTNTFLADSWNNKHINHIQIIIDEKLGVEDRARFYDKYGAVKDIIQNHAMQLLALTTMKEPKRLEAKYIREEKTKLLEKVKIEEAVLGQYANYTKEKGVDPNSKTETFAAIKCSINNSQWKNTPIYIRTGKKLARKETKIYVQFEEPPCHLFEGVCPLKANHLVINIQPNEGFYMSMNTKAPRKTQVTQVKMDFSHKREYGINTPESYENIFEEIINGDQSNFVHANEVQAAWKIVDPILKKRPALEKYEGEIPLKAKELIRKGGLSWQ